MRRTITAAAALLMAAGTGAGAARAQDDAIPIRFAAGSTSDTVSGSLPRGGDQEYVFGAAGGQTAEIDFTSDAATAHWTLVGPGGAPLHSGMTEQQDDVVVELPRTGSYRLDVQTSDPADYTLELTLPVEIRFARGGTSATVSGHLASGQTHDYTFDAGAGQEATVDFTRSTGTARWVLAGPQGQPLHTGMTEQQEHVSVPLPETGTYRLAVETMDAGDYSLRLAIPPA
ncbi:hypothetical protein [Blastococcus xanthinilyticus]|uniref:Pre-peptidase n=1 Tax=Blastococcus xanthinilyticus TaxID=1564164 RepID=A0A5S5CWY3_9ACTN|nr:hypothetical protein [Blastococcus xanthinilyticus]TYP87604.1 hypothetical protein BD833_106195 [Blastococcus xanthinilyticus]